ncbi:hypothetical protein PK35_07365 [Tamlana nanhaiensis]|uniref:Nitroreductase n=1 Tax=Neotamlana nanhaiensis TaxID=1382798 RepID=A0A0D7W3G3_9FLAO|nr:hypothetical protein [Tamlana nanhaiensis]KJD33641.1 hypothetical protein PK35_07365 [Tamlana nanhaiensis]
MFTSSKTIADFKTIITYGHKAASGHNTQPWFFKIDNSYIEIIPNLEKSLPIIDSDHRELYISIGCALENICISATNLGYDFNVQFTNTNSVKIYLKVAVSPKANYLFEQIELRQTNRSKYNHTLIPKSDIELLDSLILENHTNLLLIEKDSKTFNKLSQYICEGNNILFNNEKFKKELLEWIRFNKEELVEHNDGLTYETIGLPELPRDVGEAMLLNAFTPEKQNDITLQNINSSSHMALFTCLGNTTNNWINTGRNLQRFCLKCTQLGISFTYLNQPCEVPQISKDLTDTLLQKNEYPMIILRLGYSKKMPYSVRKSISEHILHD